jgi:ABC-type multidrug transport system fused ATPase/permease subunit
MSFGYNGISIISALIPKYLIDATTNNDFTSIKRNILIGIVSIMMLILVTSVFQYLYSACARSGVANIRKDIIEKRSKLPYEYFVTNHSSNLISYILYDTDKMGELLLSKIKNFCAPVISCMACSITMLMMNFELTFILLVIIGACWYVNTKFAVILKSIGTRISKSNKDVSQKISEIFSGIITIKSYTINHHMLERYTITNNQYVEFLKKRLKINAKLEAINVGFNIICSTVFLAIGAIFVNYNRTTFGTLVAMVSLQSSVTWGGLTAGKKFSDMFDNLASSRRIFEFLDSQNEIEFHRAPIGENKVYIELKDVFFGYDDTHFVLEGVNLAIEKNTKTALVGASGAGKTTIAKLLLGFYTPSKGTIAIDGKTFGEINTKDWRRFFAYVPQEAYIYNDTIEQNILYGKPDASFAEVVFAAKAAHAHEFIINLPNGYKTIAGQRGSNLSLGQRQRIAIARAFLRNAPILLLDEATSALDNVSEQQIQQALNNLMKNKTAIIIAHKPITISSADFVVDVASLCML